MFFLAIGDIAYKSSQPGGLGQKQLANGETIEVPAEAILAITLVLMSLNGLVLYGAIQMKSLKSYGLSMTAAILAMIPCVTSICCVLGIPFGIWAIVALNDPRVKSSFR